MSPSAEQPVIAAQPRPARRLGLFDRLVRIPLGFLWLIVLGILALPVAIVMTILYCVVRVAQAAGGRAPRRRVSPSEPAGGGEPLSS